MTRSSTTMVVDIRSKPDHPFIDPDGQVTETTSATVNFVKQGGGPEIAKH